MGAEGGVPGVPMAVLALPDVCEQLVPPRILERFTPKKVKRGSSITFSVKVEGGHPHSPEKEHPPRAPMPPSHGSPMPPSHRPPMPPCMASCSTPHITLAKHPLLEAHSQWDCVPTEPSPAHRMPSPHHTLAQGGGRERRSVDWPQHPRLHYGQLCPAAQPGPARCGPATPGHLHVHCHQRRWPGPLLCQPACLRP